MGFSRWEGKAVERSDADRQVQLGGLDMALFDGEGRIQALAQFTMRAYPQLAREGGGGGAMGGAKA